jgi:hypothetical protein
MTPFLLFVVIHIDKLLYEHVFIDGLAAFGDVYENK